MNVVIFNMYKHQTKSDHNVYGYIYNKDLPF